MTMTHQGRTWKGDGDGQYDRKAAGWRVQLGPPVLKVPHLLPTLEEKSHILYTRTGNDFLDAILEVCLGWPYFALDQAWTKEISDAALESGIPAGPLGSVCIGALAGGAPADEVQQFLNGLRPLTRGVDYVSIGSSGKDPRQLAARHFAKLRNRRDRKGRMSAEYERATVGSVRYAMNVWLTRFDENPTEISVISSWARDKDLPPLWNEEKIRAFHNQFVN